ncbi:hypothetical protein NC651_021489 [Populus alba x Populus x berolinensis]|nr:hypothetical protein NC651_021489 [Populus alba x Populus x berolinensis]
MEDLTNAMERKKKREKKFLLKDEPRIKYGRQPVGMQIDATADGYTDLELFSLSSIKGKKDLVAVDAVMLLTMIMRMDGLRDGENEETDEETQEHSPSDVDSDEEHRRFDEQMEEILDQAYERFVTKGKGSTKQRKRAKQALGWRLETAGARKLEKYESEDEMLVDGQEKEIATPKKSAKNAAGENDFEIVPAPATDSSDDSSSDESEDDDVDSKAEILACA